MKYSFGISKFLEKISSRNLEACGPAKNWGITAHLFDTPSFQKCEGECGKGYLQTLDYTPKDDNSVNHPRTIEMPASLDVQKVSLPLCI